MIYAVRHGQTDLNKEGRLQGRAGLPLNKYGVEQAESLPLSHSPSNAGLRRLCSPISKSS